MSAFISILYDSKTYRNCTQFDAMPHIPGLSKALSHQSEARELITAMWDSIVFITPQIYIEPSLAAYRLRERERVQSVSGHQLLYSNGIWSPLFNKCNKWNLPGAYLAISSHEIA